MSNFPTMNRKLPPILLLVTIVLFSSCVEHAYYLSPFTANSNPYHAIPLASDSVRGATYINTSVNVGGANYNWRDNIIAFRAGLHRSNTFGNFHLYYGGNVAIGSYNVASYQNGEYGVGMDPNTINRNAGSKFFGGYGFNGGFNALVPLRSGGEWRVIGLEGSAQNEFGNYLDFRNKLPDSAANVDNREHWTGTVGITTEIISRRRSGSTFGYKLGIGMGLNAIRNNANYTINPPTYISNTLHFGRDNWLAFCQVNFGTYTGSFQFGVNYKIGARKINH
jgi:hypothetical protein